MLFLVDENDVTVRLQIDVSDRKCNLVKRILTHLYMLLLRKF